MEAWGYHKSWWHPFYMSLSSLQIFLLERSDEDTLILVFPCLRQIRASMVLQVWSLELKYQQLLRMSETQALWPPLRLLETLGVGAQQCVPESPLQVILMPAKVWEPLEWSHSRPLTEEHHYSIWESIHPGACGLGSDARGTLREKEHPSLSNQPRPSCWWKKWSMSNGSSSHSSHRGFRKSHSLSNVACPMFTIHTAYFSSLLPAPPICPLNSHHKEWLAALQRTMLLPPHLW